MRRQLPFIFLVVAIACSPQAAGPDADGAWVGTITTEGNVTTVVNESGSVWGGTARLVEEASIGVEAGADEYMLGSVLALSANGERIAVLDGQVGIVRIYDYDGAFIANVGAPGDGPGEFRMPRMLAIDGANRIAVVDPRQARISRFEPDGEFVGSWPLPNPGCCLWSLHTAPGGRLWVPIQERDAATGESRYGVQLHGADGAEGDVLWVPEIAFEPRTFQYVDGRPVPVPLGPRSYWGTTPSGGVIAAASDRMRFEVFRRDGSKLVVEGNRDSAPIEPEEREWWRQYTVARQQRFTPGWSWDGAEIPNTRRAFASLIPAASGEIWVVREVRSRRRDACTESPLEAVEAGADEASLVPCFVPEPVIDVFDGDGRYLGDVDAPPDLDPVGNAKYVDGHTLVARTTDDRGVVRVKRYRLVLPAR